MKQLIGRLLALIILGAIIALGAVNFPTTETEVPEVSRITDYRADFTVEKDGDLRVIETLTVDFPPGRHGIFRFFDLAEPTIDPKTRLIPTDIRVARDGLKEPFAEEDLKRGRYKQLKIGSADVFLDGKHTYQIGYRIKGALTEGRRSPTQFYWKLVPQGWRMPIDRTRLTVNLPEQAEYALCAIGQGLAATACRIEGEGSKKLVVETGGIQPHTAITIQAGMDMKTPDAQTLPWSYKLDPVLGRSTIGLGIVLVLALLAGAVGAALSMSTREKKPGFPLMYAPPDGIGPAQAAYILTEDVDEKAFVATMMYAAEKGVIDLDQNNSTWNIRGAGDPGMWQSMDAVTAGAGQSLDVLAAGSSFTASPNSVAAGKKLKTSLASFDSDVKGWGLTSGNMERSGLGGGGLFVLLLTFGAAAVLAVWNPWNMSVLAAIPGLFGIGALGVGATGAGTKRTPAGRDLWSRVGGFHRILSTPSAKDRFDFSGRKELYTTYLPWAVAFDCADEWAKKYQLETGEEPPIPSYFPSYTGVHTSSFVSSMVDSFDSAVSSAISSYEATQTSSSSGGGGGGGFSGGGGGGGGGGGSW